MHLRCHKNATLKISKKKRYFTITFEIQKKLNEPNYPKKYNHFRFGRRKQCTKNH